MRIVFMGTPEYAVPVLWHLSHGDVQIVGVYTQPDKPSGRGLTERTPAVKAYALRQGLSVLQPASLRSAEAQEELGALRPEVIVVAAYGKLLPGAVLGMPAGGCLNVHPSLLPRHRGPSPVVTAILEGDSRTGVTIIKMDEGMDTGPIVAQRSIEIGPTDTSDELTHRLFEMGGELLRGLLPLWVGGEMEAQPQDNSLATITRKIERADGEVRWEVSAEELARRVRALAPWPGTFTYWKGRLLKIIEASPLPTEVPPAPGLVMAVPGTRDGVGVMMGAGVLELKQVQLEGKRPGDARDFARGQRDFVGARLPS